MTVPWHYGLEDTMSKYTVEGWARMSAVGFRTVARPLTAIREAQHLIIDKGADRVIVRRDGQAVAEMGDTMHFQYVRDEALQAEVLRQAGEE